MQYENFKLSRFIDNTKLSPNTGLKDIETLCLETQRYDMACVCVNPYRVAMCRELLRGSDVKTAAVLAFPLGAETLKVKVMMAEEVLLSGAEEIDAVVNLGALKDGDYKLVEQEINALVDLKNKYEFVLKIIIETALLDEAEIIKMTKIVSAANADFIKTSTGYAERGASLKDIMIMSAYKSSGLKIKASGGIRDLNFALELIRAGAERIGTSAGGMLCEEFERRREQK